MSKNCNVLLMKAIRVDNARTHTQIDTVDQ